MGSHGGSRAGSAGGGGIQGLLKKARNAKPNAILNNVPDNQLGSTFQSLSYSNKQAIHATLRLTPQDVEFLSSDNSYTQSQGIRIKGTRYNVIIGTGKNGKVEYSLKKGNKNIVKQGTYQNVANQLALLMR